MAGHLSAAGGKVITLAQSLKYNGQVYQIHYFTTGDLKIADSKFIARASPQFFQEQHVTALLISSNAKVVTDEEVIEQVLLRYRAAHYLYVEPNDPWFYDPAGLTVDMLKFTKSPFLIQHWEQILKNRLFNSKEEEYADAIRGILSTQLELPGQLKKFTEGTSEYAKTFETFGEAADKAVTTFQLDRSPSVRRVANYLATTTIFKSWQKTGSNVDLAGHQVELTNALDLVVFATKLIWVDDLQKDRSQMLEAFVKDAAVENAFDRDMSSAYAEVSVEVNDAWLQRGQIIRDFVEENSVELAGRLSLLAFEKLLFKNAFALAEKRISVYAITHAISLASLGYLAGDALFGIDDTYHNFLICVRTDELRQKFQSWRQLLIRHTRIQSVLVFDGDLADRYRAAYLLEAYASARLYRLYADGVEASARTGIIDQIKRLQSEEYSKAGDELRNVGIQIEMGAEETLGYPSFIEDAQRLISNRLLLTSLTVDDSYTGFNRQGENKYWNTLMAGYAEEAIWTYTQTGNPVNSGTWELSVRDSGPYLVQAYIPMPTDEVRKPYSTSAKYVITHAQGTTEFVLDQAGKRGKWADLGIYEFVGGHQAVVHLDDQTVDPLGNAVIVFDAVRFIPEEQMQELLEGEPFNFEHSLQEWQNQAQNWWDETSSQIEQAVNQWWAEQQEKMKESFDQWWQEQQKKIEDALNQWWQDFQIWLAQRFERQLTEWLNQCLPSAVLPLGLTAVVWISRRRKKL